MKIGIISFTVNGVKLQEKIIETMKHESFYIFDKSKQTLKEWLRENFYTFNAFIFIGAIGIAVRLISSLIVAKDKDPAVIVIDELGSFVIPILSGHIGGANELSLKIASKINAVPVITTATDINNKFAIDVWSSKNNCVIGDISKIKFISSAILQNKEVGIKSDFEIMSDLPKQLNTNPNNKVGISVSLNEKSKPFETTLNIIPKIITLGVGCKKNINIKQFEDFVMEQLELNNISIKAVLNIASIDLKKEEICIVEFAKKYNIEFVTFTKEQLNKVEGEFSTSDFVKQTTGVDNVCERSAVLKSNGTILLKKTSKNGITICIACSKWSCIF